MGNINFGWKQFYRPLPKPLVKLLLGFKGFLATLSGIAFFAEDRPDIAAGLLAFGAFIDFVVGFFADAPEVTLEKAATHLERDKPALDVAVLVQSKEEIAEDGN